MNKMLYLASRSPRRRTLLNQLGIMFESLAIDVDESVPANELPAQHARRLAMAKAKAGVAIATQPWPVLAADTIVVAGDQIWGKPDSLAQSRLMLAQLSGQTHHVITAVAIFDQRHYHVALSETEVTFRLITTREIDAYWQTGEPHDKAGSYSIQGLGAIFIRGIKGSYSGVMGLPLFETCELLKKCQFDILT